VTAPRLKQQSCCVAAIPTLRKRRVSRMRQPSSSKRYATDRADTLASDRWLAATSQAIDADGVTPAIGMPPRERRAATVLRDRKHSFSPRVFSIVLLH
jgi:hypothetical protein